MNKTVCRYFAGFMHSQARWLNKMATEGYDLQYGARPLKRAIQTHIEDEISQLLLDGELKEGDKIEVDTEENNGKLKFEVKR